jgi:hypothetical protein
MSCRNKIVPALGARGYLQRRTECEHSIRRPADLSQPAIELSELDSHALFTARLPIPKESCFWVSALQRPFQFEVALDSRVFSNRALSLIAFAKASTFPNHRNEASKFLVLPKTHCLPQCPQSRLMDIVQKAEA